jgi:hypothetical protein
LALAADAEDSDCLQPSAAFEIEDSVSELPHDEASLLSPPAIAKSAQRALRGI